MLDDIDYSDLTATSTSAAPSSEPKKKSNIAERSVVKPSEKPTRKPVNVEAISEKAGEMQADVGAPEIPDPLAQYGLPALGALGALGTAYGVYQSLKNKAPAPGAPVPPAPTPGPDYSAYNSPAYLRNAPVAPVAPVATPEAAALPQQTNLTPEDIQARAAQLKALEPVSTPITAAPVDAPAPTPSAAPNSPVTSIVTDTVKEMIQETPEPVAPPQELRTGTGKPAFAGMAPPPKVREKGKMAGKPIFRNEYARPEDVPAGYAFVPGAQVIDPARQDMGQSIFTKTYMAQDYPLTDKMAREQASEVNRMLGRPTRAELKASGLEAAPNTPGITQYINQPKGSGMGTKTVKVGGVLGALVAIPDLAKAETPSQRGMAGANLLEAVLPPGFTMSGAGEGSGTVPSADQAMLLGSPYAQSPLAVKRRQALEYAAKVGGGRGLTPASAYLR